MQRGPLRLLQGQRQTQANLRQALPGEQRPYVAIGIEFDTEVVGKLLRPLAPPGAAIALGRQLGEHVALPFEGRRQRVERGGLLTQGAQLQEQADAIRSLRSAQRFQAAAELLAGSEGGGVVLIAEDIVSRQHQRLGTGHILQRRQAQGRQTQQVLGLIQAPILAAAIEHAFQALAQTLLVALQVGQQAAALLQFGCTGQVSQTRIQALAQILQILRSVVAGTLQSIGLLLVPALHFVQLPEAPATSTGACQADQQGQGGNTAAPATAGCLSRLSCWRAFHGFAGRFFFWRLRGGCFAHVSVLLEGGSRKLLQRCLQGRGTGAATVHNDFRTRMARLLGNARAGYEQG